MTEDYESYRARVRYDQDKASRYAARKIDDAEEFDLIDRAFALVPVADRILDVPCGGGRITVHLAHKGYDVSAADNSDAMVDITRATLADAGLECPVSRQDIESLDLQERSFDTVLSFRLFHHFPQADIRRRAVAELCRVASQRVVMSYYNSRSVNYARRRIRGVLKGKPYRKYGTPLYEVQGYFSANGFRLASDFADRRWLRPLHVAVFERIDDPDR